MNPSLPTIVAHRGNAAEFPENTLAALESAVALGVSHVEFDVQLTADHVPVLLHDADFRRVGGDSASVFDLPWSQVAGRSVGEPHRFGTRHAVLRTNSLEQLVAALAGWDGVTAFVEIKRASLRRFGEATVLARICERLAPVMDRCVLISFDLHCLQTLRNDGRRVGWVLGHYTEAARADATALAPEFLFLDVEQMPAGATLWTGGWDWAIYEVRDVATARDCRARGAAYVETMTVRALLTAYRAAGGR
jgi:glycerophosphoryl diester phosphodiesterase